MLHLATIHFAGLSIYADLIYTVDAIIYPQI